jgi:regulator of protease activity HflC (stomatin/prohibitin superfamily)
MEQARAAPNRGIFRSIWRESFMFDDLSLGTMIVYALILAAFIIVISSFYTVTQQTVAIIERFGRYVRTEPPGLRMKIPLIEQIAKRCR